MLYDLTDNRPFMHRLLDIFDMVFATTLLALAFRVQLILLQIVPDEWTFLERILKTAAETGGWMEGALKFLTIVGAFFVIVIRLYVQAKNAGLIEAIGIWWKARRARLAAKRGQAKRKKTLRAKARLPK